ncbi:MAG: alkaline phosphatase D family protein [Akkermansiaceae bacterium]
MRIPTLILLCGGLLSADTVSPSLPKNITRPFLSGELWSNPLEDWELNDGGIQNTHSGGNRNVICLTAELDPEAESFTSTVAITRLSKELKGKGYVGFQLGVLGAQDDFRESAIYGVGLPLGLNHDGRLFIGTPEPNAPKVPLTDQAINLRISGQRKVDGTFTLTLIAGRGTQSLGELTLDKVHPSWVKGLLALTASSAQARMIDPSKERAPTAYRGPGFGSASSPKEVRLLPHPQKGGGDFRFRFTNWLLSGPAVKAHPQRSFGPIWWTTHTVDDENDLRLLAQLAPILPSNAGASRPRLILDIDDQSFEGTIDPISYTALFQVPFGKKNRNRPYKVRFLNGAETSEYTGVIQKIPGEFTPLKVASLSCNDSTGFPHARLEANVRAHLPHVITFHGDQIYEGIGGYGHIISQKPSLRANLSYLRKYAMHGWTWRDILASTPSITIPDDHDVMHGNIWGCAGKAADMTQKGTDGKQDSGGYKMSVEFVNMVHRTQCGNLPIPQNQFTCESGITTYFTSWKYGNLDFAILADRQFKSAPRPLLPDAQITNGWPQNLQWNAKTDALVEGAELLGPQQEAFLAKWAGQRSVFKVVISQSPFLAPQTLPKDIHHDKHVPSLPVYREGEYAPDDEPKPDFDTNGWPQDKQKVALKLLKKANAIHIVGDQHLGTTGQYGIESYDDGTWWIASPAIANVWPRRWMPSAAPVNPKPEWPRHLGGFEDGFGNKFTLHAVANPWDIDREPARLFDRAVGYAITTYDPATGNVTLANWPYTSGPQHQGEDAKPYPGWPVTVEPNE